MVVRTTNLYEVAFLTVFGSDIVGMEGQYPNVLFNVLTKKWIVWYMNHIGLVHYRSFAKKRLEAKSLAYNKGHTYPLRDIATVRPWKRP